MSYLVYPGATHSRFHHALGAMHLMQKAVDVLRRKHVEITQEEELATYLAILLHDVGHGPFSHALENTIVENTTHENLSIQIMERLNIEFNGALNLCLQIFKKEHPKTFLSQLIASQLDVDRLDYLKRDSFYTGVVEGNTNSDRLISMMNVANNQLVIEAKGLYSVEKFLISRTFMYWQVYLHKTSMAAEIYLIQALKRAKELSGSGENLHASTPLQHFLNHSSPQLDTDFLENFCRLDDMDIGQALKQWQNHKDPILSELCVMLVQRKLPKTHIRTVPSPESLFKEKMDVAQTILGHHNTSYFVHETPLKVKPYNQNTNPICFLTKEKKVIPLHEMEQRIMPPSLFTDVSKFHFCYLDVKKNSIMR